MQYQRRLWFSTCPALTTTLRLLSHFWQYGIVVSGCRPELFCMERMNARTSRYATNTTIAKSAKRNKDHPPKAGIALCSPARNDQSRPAFRAHWTARRYRLSSFSSARKASCGTSTCPTIFIRFLPSACFSSSLRLRVMSPP